jgi:hypothetical protein
MNLVGQNLNSNEILQKGIIRAEIVGISKQPLKNIRVTIENESHNYLDSKITNDFGKVEFDNLSDTVEYIIEAIPSGGRPMAVSGLAVKYGGIRFVTIQLGMPCTFYFGEIAPNCIKCGTNKKVIPIKRIICYGKVSPRIIKRKYIKCQEEHCYSDWYCSKCKIEL